MSKFLDSMIMQPHFRKASVAVMVLVGFLGVYGVVLACQGRFSNSTGDYNNAYHLDEGKVEDGIPAPPPGFGSAVNELSPDKELLVKATDCNNSECRMQAGGGSSNQYVYKDGYTYNGTSWQQVPLSGPAAAPDAPNWFVGSATGSIPPPPPPCSRRNGAAVHRRFRIFKDARPILCGVCLPASQQSVEVRLQR